MIISSTIYESAHGAVPKLGGDPRDDDFGGVREMDADYVANNDSTTGGHCKGNEAANATNCIWFNAIFCMGCARCTLEPASTPASARAVCRNK